MVKEDVAHHGTHVMKVRETVTDLMMVVNMMETEDAREILCAEVIIAENLDFTIMKKMIPAKKNSKKSSSFTKQKQQCCEN